MPPRKLWPYEVIFTHDPSLGDYELDANGEKEWYIIGICSKVIRNGEEFYNVRYAGNHQGRTYDHRAADLLQSHPEHVALWEDEFGETWRLGELDNDEDVHFYQSQTASANVSLSQAAPARTKRSLDVSPRKTPQRKGKKAKIQSTDEEASEDSTGDTAADDNGPATDNEDSGTPAADTRLRSSKRRFRNTPQKTQQAGTKKARSSTRDSSDESEEDRESSLDDSQPIRQLGRKRIAYRRSLSSQEPMQSPITPSSHRALSESPENDQAGSISGGRESESRSPSPKRSARLRGSDADGQVDSALGFNSSIMNSQVNRRSSSPSATHDDMGRVRQSAETEVLDGTEANSSENNASQLDDDDDEEEEGFSSQLREATQAFFSQMDDDSEEAAIPANSNKTSEIASRLQVARSVSTWELIGEALRIEDYPCSTWVKRGIDNLHRGEIVQVFMVEMLLSMQDKLLDHLLKGDVPHAAHADADLKDILGKLFAHGDKNLKPSIYINYLVDDQGLSPTPEELEETTQKVELYLDAKDQKSHDYAFKIDNMVGQSSKWTKQASEAGGRRYCGKDSAKKNILNWIEAIRARLQTEPAGDPLSRPLSEVGYATYPDHRLKQHRMHDSSNYIMNIVDAICRADFPNYKISQFVIFRLFDPMQGRLAEILFTRFAQGYITHGGGFSHAQAGASFFHANDLPIGDYKKLKIKAQRDPIYLARLQKEVGTAKTVAASINGARKRLENLETELLTAQNTQNKVAEEAKGLEEAAARIGNKEDQSYLEQLNHVIELVKCIRTC